MRYNDIIELLEYTNNEIELLRTSDNISKVKVKNILENLRSTLDYSKQDIIEYMSLDLAYRTYFPYGLDENNFKRRIDRNLPEIDEIHPSIFNLIEKLQPHKCDDNWLISMCNATNVAKHDKAVDINEKSKILKSIIIPGLISINCKCPNLIISGNIVNGKTTDNIITNNNGEPKIIQKGEIDTIFEFNIIGNKIEIEGVSYDLFSFLDKCQSNISNFIKELYKLINV